jgi:hypothetical protein
MKKYLLIGVSALALIAACKRQEVNEPAGTTTTDTNRMDQGSGTYDTTPSSTSTNQSTTGTSRQESGTTTP